MPSQLSQMRFDSPSSSIAISVVLIFAISAGSSCFMPTPIGWNTIESSVIFIG